jgi:hypothetical protein
MVLCGEDFNSIVRADFTFCPWGIDYVFLAVMLQDYYLFPFHGYPLDTTAVRCVDKYILSLQTRLKRATTIVQTQQFRLVLFR